ncbi:MAG TPA: hypothetical protein VFM75_07215 [Modicisalibacter sp.]|nr:hypothetical protein [Modicisalibacter sp.]
MIEDRRKGDRRVSPAVAEFALQERGELLARIEDQEREIERLSVRLRSALLDSAELAALKSQQLIGVALPERKELDGNGGWRDIEASAHNACIDEVAELNSPSVSAGVVDERSAFEVESEGWWNDDHNIYTWPITVGEWGARVECHGHSPAEAQQLAISIARAAQPDHSAQSEVPDVPTMARVLADRCADACNVNRDDYWKEYGGDCIEDVRAMLAAAPAPGKQEGE